MKGGDKFVFCRNKCFFKELCRLPDACSGVTILGPIQGLAVTNENIGERDAYTRNCDSGHLLLKKQWYAAKVLFLVMISFGEQNKRSNELRKTLLA
jgi:hypothetical protein